MLKLLYDLKVGYSNCYLTVLDEELDVSAYFWMKCNSAKEEGLEIEELSDEELYEIYKFDLSKLIQELEDTGYLETEYEASVLHYTKNFFTSVTEPGTCCGIWEPSNWRLVYDPDTDSSIKFINAFTSNEVCEKLKISHQQLYYYTKIGTIKKVFNPDNHHDFRYDRSDVLFLFNKLAEKYKKYSN
jgi:hypothetical protein